MSESNTLIISVSGVRGLVGSDLTPDFVARWSAAFGAVVAEGGGKVVLGRDARTSGPMFMAAAAAGLQSVGCDVVDVGLVPTPTVQLAVEHHEADGGIVITASHNPIEWNALKFVGADGVFLDTATGSRVRELAEGSTLERAGWDGLGGLTVDEDAIARHITRVLDLDAVNVEGIRARSFRVALDCVRGAGGVIMPTLLERLGCELKVINFETDGRFPRPPEPVPENLKELAGAVTEFGADVGMAVDPDVDRMALVDENGEPIGEDYTLAFAVESALDREKGPVVVNLSTSRVVEDAAAEYGIELQRAPVGEANVARAMRAAGALIGGEGNGGVMFPELHLGRDAPLAAAMVLDLMARRNHKVSELVARRPRYRIIKDRFPREGDLEGAYAALSEAFPDAARDTQDGLRLEWQDRWLHVRPSGTEPIIRAIAEAPDEDDARELVERARGALEGAGQGARG